MIRTSSPKNDKRACLCKNNTYSRKCCDGSLRAQGIGNITKTDFALLLESIDFLLQEDNGKILL
jgi:hypothetical protein